MNGGWRVGAVDFLNSGTTGYEKVLFSFSGVAAVPEPSTMLLLGFGLLAVGAGLRKRS